MISNLTFLLYFARFVLTNASEQIRLKFYVAVKAAHPVLPISVLSLRRCSNISGADYGLSLLINIEEYEYAAGLTSDAGVKVHCQQRFKFRYMESDYICPIYCYFKVQVYATNEVPLLRDLGFAIAPGLHSAVSLDYTKVAHYYHDPYYNYCYYHYSYCHCCYHGCYCCKLPFFPSTIKYNYCYLC